MRIRILSILLTIFTIIAGLNSAVGQADPMSAMAACRSGGPGQITSMKVSSDNLPFELHAYSPLLNPGDVYRVTVTGEMAIGDWWFAPSYTADGAGWADLAPPGPVGYLGAHWPQPGLPKYGLIAGWSGLPNWYWLGTSSHCIQWTGSTPVQVVMRMNDDWHLDNRGTWSIAFRKFSA